MKNARMANGEAMPNFDLLTLDDAWAAVAALDGEGQTASERAALKASLDCIERLGARPGWGTVYHRERIEVVDYVPGGPGRPPAGYAEIEQEETMEQMRARWKRNLERAGYDGSWLEAK